MTGTGHNRRTALYWSACALLAGVVVFGSIRPLLSIGRYLPLDPNEGWNAYFAVAAMTGGTLYPPADALITNNYPPLSFYVVGAIGHLTGDNIFAGRFVALASLLFVVWSLYYWLRITGSTARIGLLAALTFLAYVVTYARAYVAMDDPQWLAHALMMGGLLVIWTGKDDTRHLILGAILGTVALLAAGGAGVDVNLFLDSLIALCLSAGLAVESLWPPPLGWGPAVAVGLAAWLAGYMASLAPAEIEAIRTIAAHEQSALHDIELIKAHGHHRAACETLNLCYWAQSAFMMDFFYFGQKLKTGRLPRTACADTFEHGTIALVQLEPNLRYRAKLLPNDCDALILSRYHPLRESNFGPLLMSGAH